MQTSIFLAINFLRLLFYFVKNKIVLCRKIYHLLAKLGVWWALPMMILEPNVRVLSFNTFLQMNQLMLGYYGYMNKLNFFVTTVNLFVLLLYSLTFYAIIFSFVKKSYAKVLLNTTKYRASSFFV
jgi:hypothetical protein